MTEYNLSNPSVAEEEIMYQDAIDDYYNELDLEYRYFCKQEEEYQLRQQYEQMIKKQ